VRLFLPKELLVSLKPALSFSFSIAFREQFEPANVLFTIFFFFSSHFSPPNRFPPPEISPSLCQAMYEMLDPVTVGVSFFGSVLPLCAFSPIRNFFPLFI